MWISGFIIVTVGIVLGSSSEAIGNNTNPDDDILVGLKSDLVPMPKDSNETSAMFYGNASIDREMARSVLYYGVIASGITNINVEKQCVEQLQQILTGINSKELFAIKGLGFLGKFWTSAPMIVFLLGGIHIHIQNHQ